MRIKRVLILDYNPYIWGFYTKNSSFVDVYSPYIYENNIFSKIHSKIMLALGTPRNKLYAEWKTKINSYHTVIMDDSTFDKDIIIFIKNIDPTIRIIVYFYNILMGSAEFESKVADIKNEIELWSVDENDCLKYGMKHNELPFYQQIELMSENTALYKGTVWDVVFIGADKGRKEYVEYLMNYFAEKKLRTFTFISPKLTKLNKYYNLVFRQHGFTMNYKEVQEVSFNSRAILEILQKGQCSYTARTMEALFFKKKLITNNKNIVKSSFYNKNNIFILDIDDLNDIESFILGDYCDIESEVLNRYTIDSWLERFGIYK